MERERELEREREREEGEGERAQGELLPPAHAQRPPRGGMAAPPARPRQVAVPGRRRPLAGRGGAGHPKREGRERVNGGDGV